MRLPAKLTVRYAGLVLRRAQRDGRAWPTRRPAGLATSSGTPLTMRDRPGRNPRRVDDSGAMWIRLDRQSGWPG
jgi:hypothetical protein